MAESAPNATDELKQIEKEEEAKLIAKYPSVARPGPAFLQKRLQKGQKFFDSGDYNMAKAAVKKLPVSALSHNSDSMTITGSGDVSNPSAVSSSVSPISPINLPILPTGDSIPSPDYLATRKSSINVQSKLAIGTS